MIGTTLHNRYRLDAELGRGGMAVVFRAFDTLLERDVAVKVLSAMALGTEGRARLLREARAAASLNHPNIVTVYDAGETEMSAQDEPVPYIVMELVAGPSLHEQRPEALDEILAIARQVCAALEHAHAHGIVHRDLKPENVLLTPDGTAKLMDFGLARTVASRLTREGTVVGTVFYVAPEQALGQELDGRADLYALGVMLYELTTGQLPFTGNDPLAVISQHLHAPVVPPSTCSATIPPALDAFIVQLLSKDPAERPPSAAGVLEALRLLDRPAVEAAGAHAEDASLVEHNVSHRPVPWEGEPVEIERPAFVARGRELARLTGFLKTALEGQGRVAFITGGPGRGKTALLGEFARRAMDAHSDLLVANGDCNAYSGAGDPYLPFRDVIGMLTGEVEARWAARTIGQRQATRLWNAAPQAVATLVEHGRDLIDTVVPGPALLSRITAAVPGADLVGRLKGLIERERALPGELGQAQIFEQVAQVLRTVAARRPLLLLLDDLQWADSASIGLLFHLGRRLEGARVLIVGAYRPEEVALGRDGERHPLEKALAEFKRHYGDVWIDLRKTEEVEGRAFVDAFLDTEPNRLGQTFRQALFRHAGGHPLFTVELLRAMQDRGDLAQHEDGRWVEGSTLDWETLPARVEGVLEERIGRLEEELREILTVASVEGKDFTVQVVARVQDVGERQLLRQLSRELERRHRLVRELGGAQVGRHALSRFRFAHALFQRYLYNELGPSERRLLHREVAHVLEALYGNETATIAPQLARHYDEARIPGKAIHYLLQVGDRARLVYAHQEAIGAYQRALALLKEEGECERAARALMKLGLTYHAAFDFRRARQAYEEGFALWQQAGEKQPAVPPPPAPHPLRASWWDPTTLDPTMAGELFSTAVIEQLFSGLAELSPELDVVPDVARTWEVLDGGRKYVFHLRDDVHWSDGAPVTAGNFEYAWKRVLDPVTRAPTASLLYDVKGARSFHQGKVSDPTQVGVRALDEVTLIVELEGPTGYFPHLLAYTATYPLPLHVVEAHGEAWADVENIVTNGPFRLKVWNRGESMFLARNPEFHGRFRGNVQSVELSLLSDRSARLEEYDLAGLDILSLWDIPPSEVERVRQRHAGEYVSRPWLSTMCVGFDASRPPFNDIQVRRAFVLALDRETLADVALKGYFFPATGGVVPPGMPGHLAGIGLRYDPDRAQALLVKAGYPGGRGFPAVHSLTPPGFVPQSEYLQTQWQENLGVKIPWETMDWAKFLDRLEREPPHLFLIAYAADYPDPDSFLRVSDVRRYTRWRNETYESLVEKGRRVTDQGERMKLYGEADKILIEEAAILPLSYGRGHLLVKPWIRGLATSAIKFWFWKDVVIEPH